MSYLAIDYGKKRVGVAYSDASNRFALPHSVIENDKKLYEKLAEIIADKKPEKIIIGKSLNFKKEANIIQKDIEIFKRNIVEKFSLETVDQEEFLTSAHVEQKNDMLDASAAALILQRFLDRKEFLARK